MSVVWAVVWVVGVVWVVAVVVRLVGFGQLVGLVGGWSWVRSLALVMKLAICALVVGWSGQ